MSNGDDTRFRKGQSGNPAGRPKARRPNVSAFDIIFDKTLTVTQGGKERELTVDEALQMQTYQAALKGSRMAVRQVLKMIEKREAALAKVHKPRTQPVRVHHEQSASNEIETLRILGIADYDPEWESCGGRLKVATWAAQAALSRPGRQQISKQDVDNLRMFTFEPDRLKWPRGTVADGG